MSNKLAKSKNDRTFLARDPFGIDRFFDNFWGGRNDWWAPERGFNRALQSTHFPVTSQKNDDGSLSLFVEVPGYDKEDLTISYNEDTGILSIASNQGSNDENQTRKKTFNYQYTMRGYDPETMEATCEKGILTIRAAPYPIKENVRTIEIK